MAQLMPDPRDIERAIREARNLDISLTNAYFYLHSRGKMRNRIADLVDKTREIRRHLDIIERDVREATQ